MITNSAENILGSTSSIEELVPNYEQALIMVIQESDIALSGLANWNLIYKASGKDLREFLNSHEKNLMGTLSDITRQTGALIGMVPEVLHSLDDFSKSDRAAYRDAMDEFGLYSAKSALRRYVREDVTRSAIEAAMDKLVLSEARDSFGLYSAKSEINRHASSENARQAMYRNFDSDVYTEARDSFSLYSAKSEINRHASSGVAQAAMIGALDKYVIDEARGNLWLNSARSTFARHASPNMDKEMIEKELMDAFPDESLSSRLAEARRQFRIRYDIPSYVDLENPATPGRIQEAKRLVDGAKASLEELGFFSFISKLQLKKDLKTWEAYAESLEREYEWVNRNSAILNRWKAYEEEIISKGGHSHQAKGPRAGRGGRSFANESRKDVPQNVRIYQTVVLELTLKDQQLGTTLSSYPQPAVLKVINTVLLARQKAAEKNKEISDREILIRYMRISNTNPNATPEQVQASQIMMTLMGNKVGGKLPF